MRKIPHLIWLASLTAALLCGCGASQAEAPASVPSPAVSEPEPTPPPPSYTLDRSNIPENVNVEVTTLSSGTPIP